MIKNPIPISFNLDGQHSVQSVCAVIHIDDTNTEALDLSLVQGGEHITVSSESTVTARFVRVKDKILISDNVACEVQENGNIHIPIDNAAAHMLVGEIKIEINIVDENDILTMQFPLVIRVNNTILADAEISPESEGTIPELLEEAAEAAEAAQEAAENAQAAAEAATEAMSAKQDKLTAGDNITIENNIISAADGATDYDELTSRPQINDVTLSGNKTSHDLGLQSELTAGNNITINNGVISAEGGGVTSYEELTDKPQMRIAVRRSASQEELENIDIDGVFGIYNGAYLRVSQDGTKSFVFNISNDGLVNGKKYLLGRDAWYKYNFNPLSPFYFEAGMWMLNKDNCLHVPQFINDYFVEGTSQFPFMMVHFFEGAGSLIRSVMGRDKSGTFRLLYQSINYNIETGAIIYSTDWTEFGNGATIVSGVVNANGTITFTDSDGNTFTTSGSNIVTSGNEQINVGYDNGGFYFLFDDGQGA